MGALLITSPLPFEQPALTAEVTAFTGEEVCVCQAGWVGGWPPRSTDQQILHLPHMLQYLPSDEVHFSLLGLVAQKKEKQNFELLT